MDSSPAGVEPSTLEIIDLENQISDPIMVDLNHWESVLLTLNEMKRKDKIFNKTKVRSPAPEILNLRKYQEELSLPAIDGLNTVICSPTGSGKTIVAVHILCEHLKNDASAKVVFLVPTVTLVEQQADQIRRYASKDVTVYELTGGENNGGSTWTSFDVAVMTPQLLLNALRTPSLTNVHLEDFSLILFDECHHSNKKHPYNEIMKVYFDLKYSNTFSNGLSKTKHLPQIVGLTASLGVGDSKNIPDALEYVLNICANMDAQALSTVRKNVDELNEFVNLPVDIVNEVPFIFETNQFAKSIVQLMVQLECKIEPILDLMKIQSKKPDSCEYDPPARKWSAEYTTWVYNWLHYTPTLVDFEYAAALGVCLSHLELYHLSLDILAHLSMEYAFRFLFDNMVAKAKLRRTDAEEVALTLFEESIDDLQLISSQPDEDKLINELKRVLNEEYEKNANSRTLVFVRTCEIARLLEDYLRKDSDLKHINAGRLTGVNTRRVDGGQTLSEQKEQLTNFRTGLHKMMIATTVVEEGLDVEQCNLIIKYNHSTNEIGHMQRRGRGRAFKSKSILITHDPVVASRERANINREAIMHHVIDHIHAKGQRWFASQIDTLCALQNTSCDMKSTSEESLLDSRDVESVNSSSFILNCIKCDKRLLSVNDVRQAGSHFVCIDRSIWSRLCRRTVATADCGSKLRCTCQQEFGTISKHESVYLPVISINGFVLYDPVKNYKVNPRKWKDALKKYAISVDKISRKDLRPMFEEFKRIKFQFEEDTASACSGLNAFLR